TVLTPEGFGGAARLLEPGKRRAQEPAHLGLREEARHVLRAQAAPDPVQRARGLRVGLERLLRLAEPVQGPAQEPVRAVDEGLARILVGDRDRLLGLAPRALRVPLGQEGLPEGQGGRALERLQARLRGLVARAPQQRLRVAELALLEIELAEGYPRLD